MRNGTILVRRDGKKFTVVALSHWSAIRAEDGEDDLVKWYGMSNGREAFVSASKGFSYEAQPDAQEEPEDTLDQVFVVSRVENHRDKFYEVLRSFKTEEAADAFVEVSKKEDLDVTAARGYPGHTLYHYSVTPTSLS